MSESSIVATKCFISYVHSDNESFRGVADRLKSDISNQYEAHTGRPLDIFLDRESIGWGQDWPSRIRESVESATIFIPVVTMRYFQSESCREELMTFYSNAEELGVRELIAPVILAGVNSIRIDAEDEAIRLIARLQYKNIEEIWRQGYDSPDWNLAIYDMIDNLRSAINTSEQLLLRRETKPNKDANDEYETNEDNNGIIADASSIVGMVNDIEKRSNEAIQALDEMTTVVVNITPSDFSTRSHRDQKKLVLSASHLMSLPSAKFGDKAKELERSVFHLDGQLRSLFSELEDIDSIEAQNMLADLRSALLEIGNISSVRTEIDGFVSTMRVVSLTSVSLRKAIDPAIRGAINMKNAISMVDAWLLL